MMEIKKAGRWMAAILLAMALVLPAAAADDGAISLHLLAGFSAKRTDGEYFHLYQAGADFNLPQSRRWKSGWGLRTALSVCAGLLRADQDNSFVFSAGPRVLLDLPGGIFFLTAGARAGVMSDHSLGTAQLGGAFTFDTDLGISANLGKRLSAGYRWQHFSNADIYGENPSINLHAFDIGYRF